MEKIYSSGKLILMGEYAVLHGIDALCIPLKAGQEMLVQDSPDNHIHWSWKYKDRYLADFVLHNQTLEVLACKHGDPSWVIRLINLVRETSAVFLTDKGRKIAFNNFFPPEWGLGSSSATISSLCRYAGVDAFAVNERLTGGSGADIAAATATEWFIYRKSNPTPAAWPLPFSYSLADNTWFIYSGNKQATAAHLAEVRSAENTFNMSLLPHVNWLVYKFATASALPEISKIIQDHESLIGQLIGKSPVGLDFPDFPGKIKSLGAWGGDFLMAVSQQDDDFVRDYFTGRGYKDVFSWEDFIHESYLE